jgi:hypothetical protein
MIKVSEKIIHEHLLFKEVCIWWVRELLTFYHMTQLVAVFAHYLHHLELAGNTFQE